MPHGIRERIRRRGPRTGRGHPRMLNEKPSIAGIAVARHARRLAGHGSREPQGQVRRHRVQPRRHHAGLRESLARDDPRHVLARRARTHLRRVDPVLARVMDDVGPYRPGDRTGGTHFYSLIRADRLPAALGQGGGHDPRTFLALYPGRRADGPRPILATLGRPDALGRPVPAEDRLPARPRRQGAATARCPSTTSTRWRTPTSSRTSCR